MLRRKLKTAARALIAIIAMGTTTTAWTLDYHFILQLNNGSKYDDDFNTSLKQLKSLGSETYTDSNGDTATYESRVDQRDVFRSYYSGMFSFLLGWGEHHAAGITGGYSLVSSTSISIRLLDENDDVARTDTLQLDLTYITARAEYFFIIPFSKQLSFWTGAGFGYYPVLMEGAFSSEVSSAMTLDGHVGALGGNIEARLVYTMGESWRLFGGLGVLLTASSTDLVFSTSQGQLKLGYTKKGALTGSTSNPSRPASISLSGMHLVIGLAFVL